MLAKREAIQADSLIDPTGPLSSDTIDFHTQMRFEHPIHAS